MINDPPAAGGHFHRSTTWEHVGGFRGMVALM
jgi:hypothetical protein